MDVTAKVVIHAFVEANWKLPSTWPAAYMTSTAKLGEFLQARSPAP